MMHQYFVQPLDIHKIKPSIINKLKDNFEYFEQDQHILYTKNGYYIVNNDNVTLFKIINKDNTTQDNFLDKYTLYGNDIYTKKIENITNLPVHYYSMNIKKLSFYSKGSKNQMIIEMKQDKILKLYFTSKDKKLSENNYFFNKDISLYLKSLNI
tara:strand:+ start:605 stop:1066 length:462 start_codon:yes stop_codon:yes gene_type:complete